MQELNTQPQTQAHLCSHLSRFINWIKLTALRVKTCMRVALFEEELLDELMISVNKRLVTSLSSHACTIDHANSHVIHHVIHHVIYHVIYHVIHHVIHFSHAWRLYNSSSIDQYRICRTNFSAKGRLDPITIQMVWWGVSKLANMIL